MSKEAVARRYVDLNDQPCAVVFSQNRTVRYAYRERAFPYLDIQSGHPLPTDSFSCVSDVPEGVVSDWHEIDAGTWLSNACRASMVCEQTLAQQNGHRMTLLTLDGDYDEEAEDEALEESWTPRFRR